LYYRLKTQPGYNKQKCEQKVIINAEIELLKTFNNEFLINKSIEWVKLLRSKFKRSTQKFELYVDRF